jgi:ATP-dependent Lon protease
MFGHSGQEGIILSDIIEGETEFIPLLSQEDEELINSEDIPDTLPILPLRNTVLFPGVVIPITVGRDKSIRLVREAYNKKKPIGVMAQRESAIEDPKPEDLFEIGTVASIMKVLQMPDGNTTVIIQGKKRFKLEEMITDEPYFMAEVSPFEPKSKFVHDKNFQALISSLKDLSIQIITISPNIPSEAAFAIKNIESPVFLVNFISSNLNITTTEKQTLLEISDVNQRATNVLAALSKELEMLELKNQIQDKVKHELDKQHRDYFLNQQLKTIQEELGGSSQQQQIEELKKQAANKKWSKEVKEVFRQGGEQTSPDQPQLHGLFHPGELPRDFGGTALERIHQRQFRFESCPESVGQRSLWFGESKGTDHRISCGAEVEKQHEIADHLPDRPSGCW